MKIFNKNFYLYIKLLGTIQDKGVGKIVEWKNKNAKEEFGLNRKQFRDKRIVLSLKTYNKRYDTLNDVIKSLLLQKVKPDRFIVWLDSETPENLLPIELTQLSKYGVEFRYTNDNMKSHAKYFYAMQEFKNDIVITVDDDVIYPRSLIDCLIKSYKKFPNSISARRVHYITLDEYKRVKPYIEWLHECRIKMVPSHRLCAIGVGGILYPPGLLPQETFNMEKIKNYCMDADDIWLKYMELMNDVKVVWAKNWLVHPPNAMKDINNGLNVMNVIKNKNDIYMQTLANVYPDAYFRMINEG